MKGPAVEPLQLMPQAALFLTANGKINHGFAFVYGWRSRTGAGIENPIGISELVHFIED